VPNDGHEANDAQTNVTQTELLSADDVERTTARIAHQIIEKTALDSPGAARVILLGIPSGGVPLAHRLATKIAEFSGVDIPSGSFDIKWYRYDLRNIPPRALQPRSISAGCIDNVMVVLYYDVLFSARTTRAALYALGDIGRPQSIQLAVLVGRG